MKTFIVAATAVIVGALTAYQSRVNGALAVETGNGIQAALVSFGTGWLILCVLLALWRPYRDGVRAVIAAVRSGAMPWWQIIGGLMGGFFVGVQGLTVPLIGVAVFTVAVVAGQSTNSLIVDRFGLGPAGRQPINGARVLSAALAIVGVAVAVSDRLSGPVLSSLGPVLLAFSAGLLIAVQQALNGRVGAVSGRAVSAAFLNFTFGSLLLGVVFGSAIALSDFDAGVLPSGPWWLYTGGLVGVIFIASAAWVVQKLGVLLFALLSVSGQLLGALLLDIFAPTADNTLHWQLAAGVIIVGIAVAVGGAPRWLNRDRRGQPSPHLR